MREKLQRHAPTAAWTAITVAIVTAVLDRAFPAGRAEAVETARRSHTAVAGTLNENTLALETAVGRVEDRLALETIRREALDDRLRSLETRFLDVLRDDRHHAPARPNPVSKVAQGSRPPAGSPRLRETTVTAEVNAAAQPAAAETPAPKHGSKLKQVPDFDVIFRRTETAD